MQKSILAFEYLFVLSLQSIPGSVGSEEVFSSCFLLETNTRN